MRVKGFHIFKIRHYYNCYFLNPEVAGKFPLGFFIFIFMFIVDSFTRRKGPSHDGPFFLSYIEALFWAAIILCKLIFIFALQLKKLNAIWLHETQQQSGI